MTHQKIYSKSLCWLRRDLRLKDHRSLFEATTQSESVAVVFVFDVTILSRLKNKKDRRVALIVEALNDIESQLRGLGSKLVILHGDPTIEVPRLARDLKANAVFTNEDYEPSAKKRDQKVKEKLGNEGVKFFSFKDQVIFSGNEILKKDQTPYRVFTPYKKSWLKTLLPKDILEFKPHLRKLTSLRDLKNYGVVLDCETIGFSKGDLPISFGETGARKILKKFRRVIDQYADSRNFPALERGTSHLSPHLRFGTISIRELVRCALEKTSAGRKMWLSELIWRDFYQMILDQFPQVEKRAFLSKYENIKWPGLDKHFKSWCEGKTGFPLVDAAMRQFNETGWMHNRLRMIAASFLIKDLLIDWRRGEKYFADGLIDFDLASNNGGWQWCASTGCDAQPYFRIFNPLSQSLQFDPQGDFIRKWVPELRAINGKRIHAPPETIKNYPRPIVDHFNQRDRAISLYRKAKLTSAQVKYDFQDPKPSSVKKKNPAGGGRV